MPERLVIGRSLAVASASPVCDARVTVRDNLRATVYRSRGFERGIGSWGLHLAYQKWMTSTTEGGGEEERLQEWGTRFSIATPRGEPGLVKQDWREAMRQKELMQTLLRAAVGLRPPGVLETEKERIAGIRK